MSLSELCANLVTNKSATGDLVDKNILEFINAPWGLGLGCIPEVPDLYPAQKFIIKCYYGLPLDDSDSRNIIIRDKFNEVEQYRFNEKEYMMYLLNEGRINRVYEEKIYPNLILVLGRRAGKCLREGTLVNTLEGFREIQDLGDPNGPEFQPINVSVAQEGSKISKAAFFYNGGEQDTIKIGSYCGYGEEGTFSHRVKVLTKRGTIEWKTLGDMSIGDYLCIHRKVGMWPGRFFNVSSYKNNLPTHFNSKKYKVPDVFDEKWATFLGVLVGDGTWGERLSINVTVGPYPEWLEQVKKIFRDTVGEPSIIKIGKNKTNFRVSYCSGAIREFLNRLGYSIKISSYTKRVPWVIWRSPKSVAASFLRGFFETDGCAEKSGTSVSMSTASEQLAKDIQLLLLNFGIVSRIKPRLNKRYNKTYYHMVLLGANSVILFHKHIGFLSKRKQDLLDSYACNRTPANKSDTESIPYQKEWCKKLVDSVPESEANSVTGKMYKGKTIVRRSTGNVTKNSGEDFTYNKLESTIAVAREMGASPEIIKHFEYLNETHYFFDEITDISKDRGRVYDLNVPDGASFVANGITNHNSTITSCIVAYELYKLLNKYCPQEYYGIMPEQDIRFTCLSTSRETASELFNMITGHIERSEFFRKYRSKPTQQWLYVRTQRDIEKYGERGRSSLSIRVAPCSAKGLRGPNNMIVNLDEMAHFFADEKNKGLVGKDKNDRAIYTAVTPSVAKFKKPDGSPDGRVICLSSPAGKTGKFYEEFERSFEEDNEDLLMIQAPTWEIDPGISSQHLKNKYRENPIAYKSEYGAVFTDQRFGWIDDQQIVRQCIVPGFKYKDRSMIRVPHFAGVDIGLKNDGSAITVGHWITEVVEGVKVDKLEVDACDIRYADDEGKDFFIPEDLVEWIAGYTHKFYIARGLLDQYYGLTFIPALHKKGLKQFEMRHFNDQLNSQVFQLLLTSFLSSTIRLPEGELQMVAGERNNDSDLVKELLSLQAEQKSKYIISVHAPDREGEHDDRSSSLARMVYLAQEYKSKGMIHSIADQSSVNVMHGSRVFRRSEIMRASLNRPSSGYMSKMRSRSSMSMMGSYFNR